MKVFTLVTTVSLDKEGNTISTPPGEVELDEGSAKSLLARGQAKTLGEAKAEAEADESGPKVKTQGSGPKVKGQ